MAEWKNEEQAREQIKSLVAEYYRWKEENKALDRIPEESE